MIHMNSLRGTAQQSAPTRHIAIAKAAPDKERDSPRRSVS